MPQDLSAEERWLIDQLYAGRPAAFPQETVIDAHVLREYLLGLVSEPNGARSNGTGPCVVHCAEFRERLDLSDGRLPGGASLPALEFVNCRFHAGFCADGADLERLAFKGCLFVAEETAEAPRPPIERAEKDGDREPPAPVLPELHFERRPMKNCISLRNSRIRTELKLEQLQPSDWEGKAGVLYVDAFGVVVGTNVVVKNTTLCAPRFEPAPTDPEPRYALDLSTAEIGSDVQLMPAVRLEGGLKMRDARVGGTLWGGGLRVSDGETEETRQWLNRRSVRPREAVRLERTTIRGNLMFGMDLTGLTRKLIERKRQGGSVEPKDKELAEEFCCTLDGPVHLMNATVEGDVDLSKVVVKGYLAMTGITVQGSIRASEELDPAISQILGIQRAHPGFSSEGDGPDLAF